MNKQVTKITKNLPVSELTASASRKTISPYLSMRKSRSNWKSFWKFNDIEGFTLHFQEELFIEGWRGLCLPHLSPKYLLHSSQFSIPITIARLLIPYQPRTTDEGSKVNSELWLLRTLDELIIIGFGMENTLFWVYLCWW